MAEIRKILKDPILWKAALPSLLWRLGLGIALALLWHFTLGGPGRGWDLIVLILAVFFLCLAWLLYLRFDGFLDHKLASRRAEEAKQGKRFKELISARPDQDESPEEKKDRQSRSFLANLAAGIILLIIGAVAALLG